MDPRRFGIFLLKGVKDALLRLGCDAAARIADGKAQVKRVRTCRSVQHGGNPHIAVVGELHRVRHQIEQDLAQFAHIAPQRRQRLLRQRSHQLKSLFLGHRCHKEGNVPQRLGKVEIHGFAGDLSLFQL